MLLSIIFQVLCPPWLQEHGRSVLPGTGHLSPEHLVFWDSSCLQMCRSSLVPELALPQPGSPHTAKICISTGVATSANTAPQGCLHPSDPPGLASPTSQGGKYQPYMACAWRAQFAAFPQTWAHVGYGGLSKMRPALALLPTASLGAWQAGEMLQGKQRAE